MLTPQWHYVKQNNKENNKNQIFGDDILFYYRKSINLYLILSNTTIYYKNISVSKKIFTCFGERGYHQTEVYIFVTLCLIISLWAETCSEFLQKQLIF